MSTPFDPTRGLVIVTAQLWGPLDIHSLRLALDTGATTTLIRPAHLVAVGYDLASASDSTRVTTASGIELAPRLTIDKLEAFGQERVKFPVVAHTLPPSAGVDGLLGLDFMRGYRLVIDFRTGQIMLE